MTSIITLDIGTDQSMQPRSILDIDKSTEPFPSQIVEICRILGITLEVPRYSSFPEESLEQQYPKYRGPREEWALRWLLKKLHAANLERGSPCLEYRSWLLLRELVLLTTLNNTAQLLHAHNFIRLLQKTLEWLHEHTDDIAEYFNSLGRDSLAIADSSSTTVETPTIKATAKSRKRKRGDLPHVSYNRSIKSISDYETLYLSIYSAVIQLQKLTVDLSDVPQGFAVEHLKSAFRSSPEQTASILQSSVLIANDVLKKGPKYLVEDEARGLRICLRSVVEIWGSHLIKNDSASDLESNQVFSDRCLLPVLYFLTTCKRLETSCPTSKTLFKVLEELLLKNVLLPIRAFFLNSGKLSKSRNSELSSPPTQDLLAPLARTYYAEADKMFGRKSPGLALLPISILFSIAVQYLPRITPKQRSLEDSWLQNLFSQLVQYASMSNSASKLVPPSENYVLTVNQMLQVVADHNVRLSTFKIESLLSEVSRVLDGKIDIPNYWDLVGLCINIDATTLINTSSVSGGSQESKPRRLNEQMASLLSIVTTTGWSTILDTSSDYSTKLVQFILPLAKAFAKARDLIGFISLWQEQLAICQRDRPSMKPIASVANYARSVWEDEELLQLVARLVETSLTVGQIEVLLQKAKFNLAPFETAVSIDSEFLADMVVLDCIINARLTESYLDQLANFAHIAYTSILNMVSSEISWPIEHRWRFWRILTTIHQHWFIPHHSSKFQLAEQQAIEKAVRTVNGLMTGEKSAKQEFSEDVCMFMFMLSVASASKMNETTLHVGSAIEILSDGLNVLQNASEAGFQHKNGVLELPIQWNGQIHTIDSKEVAVLGCISQLIAYPNILSLKLESKHVFFRQLYLGAVALTKSPHAPKQDSVNYLSLWHTLLCSDILLESRLLTGPFRDFQISTYIDAASQKDGIQWTNELTCYKLAFQSLQYTPVRAFKRNQRSQIFKWIFKVIMIDGLPNSNLAVDHINLLTRYAEAAHHSLSLLGNRQGDANDNQLEVLWVDEAPLIGLVRKVKNHYDATSNYDLILALKQLGEITLKCCTTLWMQEQKIEHLASFFQQIVRIFSDDLAVSRSMAASASALLIVCSSFYANYIVNWPEKIIAKFSDFATFRLRHLESLCEPTSLVHKKGEIQEKELRELGIDFEHMALCADIMGSRSDLSDAIARIMQIKKPEFSEGSKRRTSNIDQVYTSLLRLEAILGTRNGEIKSIFRAISSRKTLQSPVEKKRLLRYLQDVIASLSPDLKLELLQIFSKAEDDISLDYDHLLLLQKAISTQDLNVNTESRNKALSQVYSTLCHKLSQGTEFRFSMLAMQTMNILLQREPRIISQWHIDNTIAAIAIVSSHMRSRTNEKHTSILYIGLCRTFSSILTIHRTKLGGRYHLILPALQGLLRCLFVPYEKAEASPSGENQESALGEAHATAYCRLLTTICDPSVSAVTRSRKRAGHELNDETKKARSIAGQHLHYLMMEYCDCQLKERLPAEMKRLLTPGIYAVFNIMSQDVMRTMNAAMGPSSRSVFKVLYDDYRRFGKWQRT